MSPARLRGRLGLTKHLVNGIVSLVLSVAITVLSEDDDHEWTRSDALLSVAIAAFLSGALTSYFAKPDADGA